MRISNVCNALVGRCYFDRKIGYFIPKICLPNDYDLERYQLMPEYNVAHIRKRYIDYLISAQRYSKCDFIAPLYQIDLLQEFPLINYIYPQKRPSAIDRSKWLCDSEESGEDLDTDRVYRDFQNQFQMERKITLFQALTEYANPYFVELKKQQSERNGDFISAAHRFNEDHQIEEEYLFFESAFLRIYAILWCKENDYYFIDDM